MRISKFRIAKAIEKHFEIELYSELYKEFVVSS